MWALAGRSELYTSYTPYQPELSQGVLQALFEYQSMVCELTALEVSNASLYDGPTALVEAVHMARAATGRGRVFVSGSVDPRYVAALEAYGRGAGYRPEVFPFPYPAGGPDLGGADVAAVIVQHPDFHGLLEPVREIFEAARGQGSRTIQIFDPLSLGVLAPPGELGGLLRGQDGRRFRRPRRHPAVSRRSALRLRGAGRGTWDLAASTPRWVASSAFRWIPAP